MTLLPLLAGSSASLAFIGGLGPIEMCVVLVIALLLFGKRLPDVMRSMGRGVVEFKRGIRGIEDEIDSESGRNKSLPPSTAAAGGSASPSGSTEEKQ